MTTGSRPRILAIATVALLLSASVSGGAIAHGPDPALSGGPFGQNQVLKFHWRAGSEPPVVIKDAIKAAANDANERLAGLHLVAQCAQPLDVPPDGARRDPEPVGELGAGPDLALLQQPEQREHPLRRPPLVAAHVTHPAR